MLEVFANTALTGAAKVLWMYIMLSSSEGVYMTTHEELAAGTGTGRATVIRSVKSLEGEGLLTAHRVSRGSHKNTYTAHMPK